MSKILIVSHQYLPHQSPRTARWKMIYDELTNSGFNVTVLTGTKQDENDLNIRYIGNTKASSVVGNLRKKSNTDQGSIVKNFIFRALKKVYRFFYKVFAWPDYTMFWIYSIWRNKNKIKIDYDVIISVSLPFSSHVAAYIINKDKGKKWIMDIGDPFSLKKNAYENNKYFYKSINHYFENKFYDLASQIIFTHEEAAEEHKKIFDIKKSKILIGNPISSFSNNLFQKSVNYDYFSRPIIIGYFGILTQGVRSSEKTLKLFKNSNFEFHWYTNPDSKLMIKQNDIDLNKHKFFEIIPRDQALEKMTTSIHCLLSIGNLNASQLPSKVIEYISTGKPVLHFAEIKNDPVIKIAQEFKNLIIVNKNSDISELDEKIDKLFLEVKNFEKEKFLEYYSAASISKKLDII